MTRRCEYALGMDCGTTNIKAALLRGDGAVAAAASRPNQALSPGPDMREQDAEVWWRNAAEIFRELTAKIGAEAARGIRGICVSSLTPSLLPVDAAGAPLRPAMTYQDGRSAPELAEIVSALGAEHFTALVGGKPAPAFLPGKLLWYRRHEPEKYDKTAYFLQASSYINFKLTGVMALDIDQALRTQCMDMKAMAWSEEIARAVGVPVSEKMPPLRQADEVIGAVTEKASRETGLPAGIPVLAGCSDALASVYATGMSRLGDAGESSGTSSLVFAGSTAPSAPDAPVMTRPCPIEGMPWVFDAPISTTGAAIKWYIDKFAGEERRQAEAAGTGIYDYLNALALESPPGAGGVLFYPYLLGERAPLWNDHASGMFLGLRMELGCGDLIRAVFEGTAYALRHVLDTVRADGARADLLRVCGGGAGSRTWNRIKAAVLNLPVHVVSASSGDVPVGDALIAGHRTGLFPDLHAASEQVIHIAEVIEPDPAWAAVYDALHPYYRDMYAHLDGDLRAYRETRRALGLL